MRIWSRTSPGASPSRSTPPASSTSSWPSSPAGKPPTAMPKAGSSRPPTRPWERSSRSKRGIKIFAGPRTDSFFNFINFPIAVAAALANGTFPDLAALFPPTDTFLNNTVRSVLIEAPAEVTGLRRLNYWATTAIYDQGHGWVQLQRAGGPNGTTFWNFVEGPAGININATVPAHDLAGRPAHPDTDPATGVWGQIRDQTAASSGRRNLQPGDPRPAHRAGLRRVRGRRIPPHGHPVHPRHQRPVGPLAGQPQRQGPDRRRVRQRHQSQSSTRTSSPALLSPRSSSTTSPTSPRRRKADPPAGTPHQGRSGLQT